MICPACRTENDDTAESCFTCGRSFAALTQGALVAGRYDILKRVGRGGMGTVYQAHDRTLDETVALKVLRSDFAQTPEMAQRFRSEIKLARRVSHKNVCRIHEYGEDGGLRYISMEFIDGVDLARAIRSDGPLPPVDAYDVAIQAAKGLEAIHIGGIIHRDLKTANIMRDSGGVVRLMDFGLAKQSGTDSAGDISLAGTILGTPEYMSPEQARGQKVDFRSDIYSLGVVVYEIFSGSVPFRGETPVATLLKHSQEPPPLEGHVPPALVPVLRKALAKDPDQRYATVRGMMTAIRFAHATSPPERTPPAPPRAPVAPLPEAAAHAAAAETFVLPPTAAPAPGGRLEALLRGLSDASVLVRWRAVVALADLGPEAKSAVPDLVETLNDPAESVADAAAAALQRIAGRPMSTPPPKRPPATPAPSVAPAVTATIGQGFAGEDATARWRMVMALGEMGSDAEGSVPFLIEALDDPDPGVRSATVVALGKIGPGARPAVQFLAAALGAASDDVLRRQAATALAGIGPAARDAIPALVCALRDPGLGDEAAQALLRIGPTAVPALIEALRDDDEGVRLRAADTLTRIASGS